ncbi:DUF6879 family protein [Nocardia sp. NPDC024068]|uniref:DUF6879 family protein n=1 Tax=Nocardia sp. NPDC024068 TaxID=3157197 RepID=UPI0033CDD22A
MELRQGNPWPELFRQAKRSAFHLEVRDTYAVPSESDPFRRFLDGAQIEKDRFLSRPWIDLVRQTAGRGVGVSRVRVVTVPHSDYQRWLLSVTGGNVEAGEDIRYLPRHAAGTVPPDDFWLFDDRLVGFNLTDHDGKPVGAAVTTDPGIAAYCGGVRDRLWEIAIPYADYIDR